MTYCSNLLSTPPSPNQQPPEENLGQTNALESEAQAAEDQTDNSDDAYYEIQGLLMEKSQRIEVLELMLKHEKDKNRRLEDRLRHRTRDLKG